MFVKFKMSGSMGNPSEKALNVYDIVSVESCPGKNNCYVIYLLLDKPTIVHLDEKIDDVIAIINSALDKECIDRRALAKFFRPNTSFVMPKPS